MPSPWAMRDYREARAEQRPGCHATAMTAGRDRCKRTATRRVRVIGQHGPGVAVCWQHAPIVARQYERAYGPTATEERGS